MKIRIGTALPVALAFAAIAIFLVSLVVRARAQKVMTGMAGMENTIGIALTPLSPRGKVFVHGEYWDAVSATSVSPGASIRVIGMHGLTLKVEPAS
jgi:membrane-bound serine protease (ClpP class)